MLFAYYRKRENVNGLRMMVGTAILTTATAQPAVQNYVETYEGVDPEPEVTIPAPVASLSYFKAFILLVVGLGMVFYAVLSITATRNDSPIKFDKPMEYEKGELIYYGECAKRDANLWKTMDVNSSISYPTGLYEKDCSDKPIAFNYGVFLQDYKFRLSKACVHNEHHCLCNRQLFDLDVYSKRVSLDQLDSMLVWYMNSSHILMGDDFCTSIMDFYDWNLTIKDSKKRERSIKAHNKRSYEHGRDGKISGFIKKELIAGKTVIDDEKPDKYAARLIQATDAYINNTMGPYMYTFGKCLKNAWKWYNNTQIITYASGLNRRQIGKWYDDSVDFVSTFGEPICYESDFSKFDKHHTKRHLEAEYNMMEHVLKMPKEVRQACESTYQTKGFMPHGTKYSTEATRKSGFQDTTIGNTLLNGVSQLYSLCRTLNCSLVELMDKPIRLIVLGDDCYMITTKEIANKYLEDDTLANLGWDVKKKIGPLYEGTFCSALFMPSSKGTILTGIPVRAIGKTFTSVKQIHKIKQQKYYCNVVAKGLLVDNKHNPVMRPLLERLISLTEGNVCNKTGFMSDYWYKWGFDSVDIEVDIDSKIYSFYANRYGISPSEIFDFAQYCRSIPNFKCGLSHPVLDKMISIDFEDVPSGVFERQRDRLWSVVNYTHKVPRDEIEWYALVNRADLDC